jgi:hypothetical protein
MKTIYKGDDDDMAELTSPEFKKKLEKYKKKMGFTFEKAEEDARKEYLEQNTSLPNKKAKSPTKKAIKTLIKEVEDVKPSKKVKTTKVEELIKQVDKAKDISDIKKMIKQSEETKPKYISTKEVDETIKDMEYYIATTKLPKDTISHAKKKAKLIADKIKSDPTIIPVLRGTLLQYNYPIIHEFYTGYPDLFKELYPKTDVLHGKQKSFMEKIEKDKKKEIKKKETKTKTDEAKAQKKVEKEKYSKTKGMTDDEIKKFKQAKAYVQRITSPSTGKYPPLNDKELVEMIARECVEIGFTKMSEKLFLEAYAKTDE